MMRADRRSPVTPCAAVRPLIVGYADGSLARDARSLVGRHLSECPACDADYLRIRALTRDLRATLPAIGAETRPLGRMWLEITAQIRRARRKPVSTPRLATGAVALVMAIAFALTHGADSASRIPPTQPTAASESQGSDGTHIAFVPPVSVSSTPEPGETTATLAPSLESNYAPTPGATEPP